MRTSFQVRLAGGESSWDIPAACILSGAPSKTRRRGTHLLVSIKNNYSTAVHFNLPVLCDYFKAWTMAMAAYRCRVSSRRFLSPWEVPDRLGRVSTPLLSRHPTHVPGLLPRIKICRAGGSELAGST